MRWEKATIEQNETGQGERIFTRHKPVKTDEDDESTLLRPIISMIAHTQTHKLKAKTGGHTERNHASVHY